MLSYMKILRPLNGVMSAFAVYVASVIAGAALYPSIPVILGMLSVFLITSAGMVINDYFDVVADRVNKPHRPLPSGRIRMKAALAYSMILFVAGIFLSFFINKECFMVAVFASLILLIYPVKLKKIMLVGHLSISLLVAMNFVFGGLIAGNYLPTIMLAVLAFLSNTGREIFKTIEDAMGDRHAGITTMPIKHGVVRARMAASFFIMAAVITSFAPLFVSGFGVVYLFFIVITDIVFIAAIAAPKNLNSKICKFAMFVAMLAFLSARVV